MSTATTTVAAKTLLQNLKTADKGNTILFDAFTHGQSAGAPIMSDLLESRGTYRIPIKTLQDLNVSLCGSLGDITELARDENSADSWLKSRGLDSTETDPAWLSDGRGALVKTGKTLGTEAFDLAESWLAYRETAKSYVGMYSDWPGMFAKGQGDLNY